MSQAFENARFFETLDEVGGMLAELAFIDLAKPYLEGVAWNALFDMHDIELGERHPFTVRVCIEDDAHWSEIQGQLGDYAETAGDTASGDVEALVETTRTIVGFDPARHRQTVEQLARIHDFLLRQGTQDLGQLERSLDDWTGSAADAFALDFYEPLELVHANQCYLLSESAKAMTMAIGVYETAQDALMNAVLAVRDVLDEQLRARAGGKGGPSSQDFLTVAAAALTVVTSLRFVSPPAAAALTMVNIGVGLARMYAVSDEGVHETATIEAATAEEAAAALSREVSNVAARTDRALTNLSGEFAPVRSAMSDMLDDDRLHPPRPGLTADTPPARFHF
jgi:predicted RNA-binding Zn ribbon-like protein